MPTARVHAKGPGSIGPGPLNSLRFRKAHLVIVSVPVLDTPEYVPLIVAVVFAETAVVVTVNVTDLTPALK